MIATFVLNPGSPDCCSLQVVTRLRTCTDNYII